MIPNLGNFKEDATVYIMFNTFSSDDPSASCTITNFANTDVHIHKDDGLAQRNNAAGITVSVDFDGITGSHMIKIDTSDNTVAGFWVTGKDYFVRIEGTTIDGGTINAVVGRFSIENRFQEVDVVKWLGQACAAVTVNGVPEVDITHLLGTAWLSPGVAGTPDVNAKQLGGTAQTGRDVGADVLLSSGSGAGQLDFTSGVVKSNLAQILGTALTETAGWLAAGFKKLFNVATPVLVASDVMRGTDSANTVVPDAAGVAPTVGEIRSEIEGVGTKLTLVLEDTGELQTNQGNWATATTVALSAQGKLDVNVECDSALSDYDSPTRTEATADKDAIIVEVDANETKIDLLQTDSTAIKAKTDNLPSGISKNVLLNNFEFLMVLSSDHISPATGKTIACQRSIDGAAFANCNSATATEVSAGIYKLNLAASDLNGDIITLKFSEATCDTTIITIKTES